MLRNFCSLGSASIAALILAAAVALGVTACHTGGGYTVGGTVTGLKGSGLVLQNNSGNNVSPKANGAFVFSSAIDQGGPYSVTIRSQPTAPAQTCAVYNGSGTIGTADVTNIVVTCTEPGRYAYVANQGSNTISAYSIDAASGRSDGDRRFAVRQHGHHAGLGGRGSQRHLFVRGQS